MTKVSFKKHKRFPALSIKTEAMRPSLTNKGGKRKREKKEKKVKRYTARDTGESKGELRL